MVKKYFTSISPRPPPQSRGGGGGCLNGREYFLGRKIIGYLANVAVINGSFRRDLTDRRAS